MGAKPSKKKNDNPIEKKENEIFQRLPEAPDKDTNYLMKIISIGDRFEK
jgi:hypothetical protein